MFFMNVNNRWTYYGILLGAVLALILVWFLVQEDRKYTPVPHETRGHREVISDPKGAFINER